MFRGSKEYSGKQIGDMLGLNVVKAQQQPRPGQPPAAVSMGASR